MRLGRHAILLLIIFIIAILSIVLATYFLTGAATPKEVLASMFA